MKNRISTVAVVGAGAVGSYFGGLLARAGHVVTLIARNEHVKAIQENGLYMECQSFQEHVLVKASTQYEAIAEADLILFCVKSTIRCAGTFCEFPAKCQAFCSMLF